MAVVVVLSIEWLIASPASPIDEIASVELRIRPILEWLVPLARLPNPAIELTDIKILHSETPTWCPATVSGPVSLPASQLRGRAEYEGGGF